METASAQNSHQSKLTIMYFMRSIKIDISRVQLNRAFFELDILSYFDLMNYIDELLESGMVAEKQTPRGEYLYLTYKGKSALEEFIKDVRHSFKLKIDEYCDSHREEFLAEKDFVGEYFRLSEKEYRVTLRIYEHDVTVFDISVKMYSEEDAKNAIKNWRTKAPEIHSLIFSMLS